MEPARPRGLTPPPQFSTILERYRLPHTPRPGVGTVYSHVPNPIRPPPKPLLFSVPSSPTTTALSQVSPSLTWTTSSTRLTGMVHLSPIQGSFTQSHQLITLCLMLSSSTSMYLPTYLTSIYLSLSISLYLPIIYLLIELCESQLMTLHLNPLLRQLLRARTVSFHDHSGNTAWIQYCSLIYVRIQIAPAAPITSFIFVTSHPGSNPAPHMAFCSPCSLLYSRTPLQAFLSFMKSPAGYFAEWPSVWVCLMFHCDETQAVHF